MIIIQSVILLSAFLLFQIELIIAKLLLPYYGGSYSVWGACVVFFQFLILSGYFYAHLLLKNFTPKQSRMIHAALSFLPLLAFPGRELLINADQNNINLVFQIFIQLSFSIGSVFFILSSMSVVWQGWMGHSRLKEKVNPYRLYAVSNLGSFAALFTYPFLFERYLTLDAQIFIWRTGYFILLALQVSAFFRIPLAQTIFVQSPSLKLPGHSRGEFLRWMTLSAAGVMMFLAVTNIITSEITPMPLLWVVPLGVYLLSFCFNFKEKIWCPAWITENIWVVAGSAVLFYFFILTEKIPLLFVLLIGWGLLFLICMFCQNQLIRTKPEDQKHLTDFYLAISLGGFLGGILVSWVIPVMTAYYLEYLLALFLLSCGLLVPHNLRPIKIERWKVLAAIQAVIIVFLPLLSKFLVQEEYLYRHRNYYGIIKIFDQGGVRFLKHGETLHGMQYASDRQKPPKPLAYYHPGSPAGKLLSSDIFDFKRIAMVGLGAGSLASYGRDGREIESRDEPPASGGLGFLPLIGYMFQSAAPDHVRAPATSLEVRRGPTVIVSQCHKKFSR